MRTINEEMVHFKEQLDAKICYEDFSGECFTSDEKIKVIVSQPDDGGVWAEDPETGEEELYKLDQLYVSKDKLEAIEEIKNSPRYTSYR